MAGAERLARGHLQRAGAAPAAAPGTAAAAARGVLRRERRGRGLHGVDAGGAPGGAGVQAEADSGLETLPWVPGGSWPAKNVLQARRWSRFMV